MDGETDTVYAEAFPIRQRKRVPQQNGVAERYNRTLLDLTRAMLIAKHLPKVNIYSHLAVLSGSLMKTGIRESSMRALRRISSRDG